MSVFYSLTDKILLEVDYNQIQFNNIDHPLAVIEDGNDDSKALVNEGNDPTFTFNNGEESAYVRTQERFNVAIMGKSTQYYYPNVDENITVNQLSPSGIGLQYISVRLHILAGYTFQDIEGILFSIFVKDTNGKKIYLLKQAFRKANINRYSYSETPKNIGDLYYDKYLDFKIIDFNDIITNGVNKGFFDDKLDFGDQSVLFASFNELPEVSFDDGFEKYLVSDSTEFSFSTRDEYDLLTASVTENDKGYIEYLGKWDGGSIGEFLSRVNSLSGNAYYIIHELDIYGQVNNSLDLLESINQVQTSNYDVPKRIRPVVPDTINGSLKVDYTVRLLNKNDGESIIKQASLSISDISPYLESIPRIKIQQENAPIKVYSKIVNQQSDRIKESSNIIRASVPVYINSFGATIGGEETIDIDPFDNIYVLTIQEENDEGEVSLFNIDPLFRHKMVFRKDDGGTIEVNEVFDASKRSNSKLTFKIDKSTAKSVIANGIKAFYIVAKSDVTETTLLRGKLSYAES